MDKNSIKGNYGIVKIVNGMFKDRFAYYDDDEIEELSEKEKAIIMIDGEEFYINYNCLTNDYTYYDLLKRKIEIIEGYYQTNRKDKKLDFIGELLIIEQKCRDKLENYIENNNIFDKTVCLVYPHYDNTRAISLLSDLSDRKIYANIQSFEKIIKEESNIKTEDYKYIVFCLSRLSSPSELESLKSTINKSKTKIILIDFIGDKQYIKPKDEIYIDFSEKYNKGLEKLISIIQ